MSRLEAMAQHMWDARRARAKYANLPDELKPGVGIIVDEIAIGRAVGGPCKNPDAAVVIATDRGPEQSSERVFTPPLRSDDLTEGSCLAGSPCLDVLWFRGAGRIFILSAKIGADAYGRQQDALASLIRSVRFVG